MQVSVSETNVNDQILFIYNFFKVEAGLRGVKLHYKNSLPSKESTIKTDRGEGVCRFLQTSLQMPLNLPGTAPLNWAMKEETDILSFYVKDTGNGIHQDQKELIFERFRQGSESLTRNYEGAGLGLSISKAYVENVGWKNMGGEPNRQRCTILFHSSLQSRSAGKLSHR